LASRLSDSGAQNGKKAGVPDAGAMLSYA